MYHPNPHTTDRQTRQTDTQTHEQTVIWTDRQTHRHTNEWIDEWQKDRESEGVTLLLTCYIKLTYDKIEPLPSHQAIDFLKR